MKSLGSRLQVLWCKATHPAPMWPVHGHYQCPVCMRLYPVAWEQATPLELVSTPDPPAGQTQPQASRATAPATAFWR